MKEENDDLEDHLDEAPRPHAGEGVDPHPQEQDPLTLERLQREIKSVDTSNSHSEKIENLNMILQHKREENIVTKVEHKSQETETEKFDTGSAELSAMMASTDAADTSQDLDMIEQSNDTRASLAAEVEADEDKVVLDPSMEVNLVQSTLNLDQAGAIASILSSIIYSTLISLKLNED